MSDPQPPTERQPLALDPLDLARLASMSVRARVIVEGAFAGMHHNPHAGTSIEFAEHKEYAPGDDIRHLDWKAVGRVGRYYIKRYEDETESFRIRGPCTSAFFRVFRGPWSSASFRVFRGHAISAAAG